MSRTIDADALINRIVFHTDFKTDVKELFEDEINAEPTIEPQRKKGKWIWSEDNASWCCSICGCVFEEIDWKPEYNFCPNCGVEMTEGEGC